MIKLLPVYVKRIKIVDQRPTLQGICIKEIQFRSATIQIKCKMNKTEQNTQINNTNRSNSNKYDVIRHQKASQNSGSKCQIPVSG